MIPLFVRVLLVCLLLLVTPGWLWAGMPSARVILTELGRMRLEAISFFLFGFLASAGFVQLLWNFLRRDFKATVPVPRFSGP